MAEQIKESSPKRGWSLTFKVRTIWIRLLLQLKVLKN
jgi:hypothetical protein